jgi:SAM-dependent methyltransferase
VKEIKVQLKRMIKKILGKTAKSVDYREYLFHELRDYLKEVRPKRILEIGPRDGKDTIRLLTLEPDSLVIIDLPGMEESNALWLNCLNSKRIEYLSANFMYAKELAHLEPFDCIWCTGVLYHNPEQLRMIRKLYDFLKAQGVLVIESATIRRRELRDYQCVEIIYPASPEYKRKYHVSQNVTHLPSASAMKAWLKMVGFHDVQRSNCHKKQSAGLARDRAAFICRKRASDSGGMYYATVSEGKYLVGKAL